MTTPKSDIDDVEIRVKMMNAQSLLMTMIIDSITADATTPIMHLKRLFAAVATLDFSGHKSIISVLRTCIEALSTKLIVKKTTIRSAMLTCDFRHQS